MSKLSSGHKGVVGFIHKQCSPKGSAVKREKGVETMVTHTQMSSVPSILALS